MQSWQRLTAGRNPGSPAWLPEFRDGSTVRCLDGHPEAGAFAPWGPVRIVFLQYSSDAISFFGFATLWREPDWMKAPCRPEVLPGLRWLPVVTALQVGFDLLTATTPPRGQGHSYLGRHSMAGWLSLLSPEEWDAAGPVRLAAAMDARGLLPCRQTGIGPACSLTRVAHRRPPSRPKRTGHASGRRLLEGPDLHYA